MRVDADGWMNTLIAVVHIRPEVWLTPNLVGEGAGPCVRCCLCAVWVGECWQPIREWWSLGGVNCLAEGNLVMAGNRFVGTRRGRRAMIGAFAGMLVAAGLLSASADAASTGVKIGDRVWVDADGDGVQDGFENGLAGVTVQLWAVPERVLVSSKQTAAGGWYSFTGLQGNRCYRLKVVIPGGFKATKQDVGTNDAADSDINTEGVMPKWVCPGWGSVVRTGWDAGLVSQSVEPLPPAVITGLFFEDLNNNRVLDPGEPGVSGAKAKFEWGPSDVCGGFPWVGADCVPVDLGESAPTGPDGRFRFELDFNGRPPGFACGDILSLATVGDSNLLFSRILLADDRDILGYSAQNGQQTVAFPCFHSGETWESDPAPMVRPAP